MKLNVKDLEPKKTAVLVIDLQNDFCHEKSVLKRKHFRNKRCAERVYRFVNIAERAGVTVLFTQQIFDSSKLNWRHAKYYKKLVSGEKESFGAYRGEIKVPCVKGSFGAEYFNYKPHKDRLFIKNNFDIWQNKKFVNFLDKNHIETLIITGVEIACCVLYAILGAEERGFSIVVPKDLVSGVDEGRRGQKNLLKIINEMYGPVVSSKEIIKIWTQNSGV